MRQRPDLRQVTLAASLRAEYGLPVVSCCYLPIGYDLNAFVVEAAAADGRSYFVKVRIGAVNPSAALVPCALAERGIPGILAPLRTREGAPCCCTEQYSIVVYPCVRGENAMVAGLSDSQWREFGATLAAIHSGGFASALAGQIPAETFSLPSAALVRRLLARVQGAAFDSPVAASLAALWRRTAPLLEHVLLRAEALGGCLRSTAWEYVLCHGDIHAANILVGEDGGIHLVDWDGPLLAPRERDLLFVVGSRIARPVEPREEALFFEAHGHVDVSLTALTYYRYERAVEDIGEWAQRVFFDMDLPEEMRADEAEHLRRAFDPGSVLEQAMQADAGSGGLPWSAGGG